MAALEGQRQWVQQLINSGADVSCYSDSGLTPLHSAAAKGHDDIARLLIASGADVNALSRRYGSPLTLAALNGHEDTVQLLLDHRASQSLPDGCGLGSALHCASYCGNLYIVEKLLNAGNHKYLEQAHVVDKEAYEAGQAFAVTYGAKGGDNESSEEQSDDEESDTNSEEEDEPSYFAPPEKNTKLFPVRYTPLMVAAERGYLNAVWSLIDHGANIKTVTKDSKDQPDFPKRGGTALLTAAAAGQAEVMGYLIEKGADIHQASVDGMTPLLAAATSGSPAATRLLMERGASTHSRTSEGYTALMLTAACIERDDRPDAPVLQDFAECTRLLLASGINATTTSDDGQTALMFLGNQIQNGTIRKGTIQKGTTGLDVASQIIDAGVDVDARDVHGHTALMYASIRVSAIANFLIEQGADVAARSPRGMSALHLATLMDHDGLLLSMYDRGARLDWTVDFGKEIGVSTPLALATAANSIDSVKLLLELKDGVDIEFANARGLTSLSFACRDGSTEIIDMLLEAGAKPRMNQLWYALLRKNISLARKLFEHDAVLDDTERFGERNSTLLHYAADAGLTSFVKLFLDNGADVDATDIRGRTAVSLAVEEGHKRTVDALLAAKADITILHSSKPRWDPMAFAVASGKLSMVQRLHTYGANLGVRYDLTGSLLHIAVASGNIEITSFLIDQGVDLYARDVRGLTAYECAVVSEAEDSNAMVSFLFSRFGADDGRATMTKNKSRTSEQKPPLPPRPNRPSGAYAQYQEQVTVEQLQYQSSSARDTVPPGQFGQPPSALVLMKHAALSFIAKRVGTRPARQ